MKLALFFLLCFLGSTCETSKNEEDSLHKSKISFLMNDAEIKLSNDFEIEIKQGTDILSTKIMNDSLFWNFSKSVITKKLQIIFKKSNTKIIVNEVPGFLFANNNKMNLIFGIAENSYFDELGLVLVRDSLLYKDIKTILYLKIDPLDNGIGRIYKTYQK
jgi:hypothetical protein